MCSSRHKGTSSSSFSSSSHHHHHHNITLSSSSSSSTIDYRTSLLRLHTNRRAALELASFLRLLSNEMTQDEFATVENEVYAKAFALVHSKGSVSAHNDRLAGVEALDALLTVPSADEERRAIRFGNNLSYSLKGSNRGGGVGSSNSSGGNGVKEGDTTATTTTTADAAPPVIDYEYVDQHSDAALMTEHKREDIHCCGDSWMTYEFLPLEARVFVSWNVGIT
jgi:hypothetical protein